MSEYEVCFESTMKVELEIKEEADNSEKEEIEDALISDKFDLEPPVTVELKQEQQESADEDEELKPPVAVWVKEEREESAEEEEREENTKEDEEIFGLRDETFTSNSGEIDLSCSPVQEGVTGRGSPAVKNCSAQRLDDEYLPDVGDRGSPAAKNSARREGGRTQYPPLEQLKCSICDKRFPWKSHLVRHLRWHTGEKPEVCHVCRKGFSQKSDLNQHMRMHTGEKPEECSVCRKRFSHKSNLHQHMLTHMVEKPEECSVCGRRYSRKSTLDKHMRTHTEENSEEWPLAVVCYSS